MTTILLLPSAEESCRVHKKKRLFNKNRSLNTPDTQHPLAFNSTPISEYSHANGRLNHKNEIVKPSLKMHRRLLPVKEPTMSPPLSSSPLSISSSSLVFSTAIITALLMLISSPTSINNIQHHGLVQTVIAAEQIISQPALSATYSDSIGDRLNNISLKPSDKQITSFQNALGGIFNSIEPSRNSPSQQQPSSTTNENTSTTVPRQPIPSNDTNSGKYLFNTSV